MLRSQGYGLGEDQPFQALWEPNIENVADASVGADPPDGFHTRS